MIAFGFKCETKFVSPTIILLSHFKPILLALLWKKIQLKIIISFRDIIELVALPYLSQVPHLAEKKRNGIYWLKSFLTYI